MSLLENKAIKYNHKMIRANSLKVGDVLVVGDTDAVVSYVEMQHISPVDDTDRELLARLKEASAEAKEKVSEGFDELVIYEAIAYNADKECLENHKFVSPEWALVTVQD